MGKRRAQQAFSGEGFEQMKDSFGGSLLKGNPKGKRPLESKLPIHLTLRARKSVLRTPDNFGKVDQAITKIAKKYAVRVYKRANVGNHIHLAIKIPHVYRWAAFIRELTGKIALICRVDGGLWMFRPHTRIVRGWKEPFRILKLYIDLNLWEAEGHIDRWQIKTLKELRDILGIG